MGVALDLGFNALRPFGRCLEIRHLEPEQGAVSEGNLRRGERPMVVFHLDVVQLQDELSVADELLVLLASVCALGTEDLPVEPA